MASYNFSYDKFFRDKHDKLVIYQKPNPPIIVFAVSALVAILAQGVLFVLAAVVAGVALAVWAYGEIVHGLTPFRQALGWLAAAALAVTLIALFVEAL